MAVDVSGTVGMIWDCMEQDYKMIFDSVKPGTSTCADLTILEKSAVRKYREDRAVCDGAGGMVREGREMGMQEVCGGMDKNMLISLFSPILI